MWVVFDQEFLDSEGLQNTIDECTMEIDNMGTSGHDLEGYLNNVYNQYGSMKQKHILV